MVRAPTATSASCCWKRAETSVVMPEKKDLLSFNAAKEAHLALPKPLLVWGTVHVLVRGRVYSVNYTLFVWLVFRATISATFNEIIPNPKICVSILDSFSKYRKRWIPSRTWRAS